MHCCEVAAAGWPYGMQIEHHCAVQCLYTEGNVYSIFICCSLLRYILYCACVAIGTCILYYICYVVIYQVAHVVVCVRILPAMSDGLLVALFTFLLCYSY